MPATPTIADVLIIGGGAAGLMCAIAAGRRGQRVVLVEHANRCGKKILMSGGGRCNFTNTGATPAQYLSSNPHFCKSALARYTPWHFIELVERHRIAYHEKELGQLFCDESSKLIVKLLLDECAAANVRIETSCSIERVVHGDAGVLHSGALHSGALHSGALHGGALHSGALHSGALHGGALHRGALHRGMFHLHTARGVMTAPALVVASGGLSIPAMGATGFGYELARQFGHAVLPTRAGLVPLTLTGKHQERLAELSGVALPIEATSGRQAFANAMLVTHRGLSGPAILQVSSFWEPGQPLRIDLLPKQDAFAALKDLRARRPAAELRTALAELVPKRFAERLCESWLDELQPRRPLRQFNDPQLRAVAEVLREWPITASGTEGYRTAEVTLGGVDTDGLSSTTMMSRHVPGLYFIGEVVDVTGWLGGYNFQWAWASGHAAGSAV